MTRRNKFIEAIENGRRQIVGVHSENSDLHRFRRLGDSDLDFVWVDMEHEGFDIPMLANSLQWLVSRPAIKRTGDPWAGPAPLVRIPANASERNQWIIKQVLDYGAFGIVQPRVQTAADVESLVRYSRYPQGLGHEGPERERGLWIGPAQRYWGCANFSEYLDIADVWPLNPNGEIMLQAIIEDYQGLDNIDKILAVPGLGSVIFGPGDLSMSLLGHYDGHHPDLVAASERVLKAAKNAGVAVGTTIAPEKDAYLSPGESIAAACDRELERGFQFLLIPEDIRPATNRD